MELTDGNSFEIIFDRVFRQAKMDPLLEKLIQKRVIPIKPNDGQVIRGEEMDESLTPLQRARDLYVFRSIRGRYLANKLRQYDMRDRDDPYEPVESKILAESDEKIQEKVREYSADATRFAKKRVSEYNRVQVQQYIDRIKKEFDNKK